MFVPPQAQNVNGLERVVSSPQPGVTTRQLVVWENGGPVVKNIPLITAAQVKDLHAAALTQLYAEPYDELAIEMGLPPSRFYGMTLIEVMLIKRAENAARTGDCDEVEKILDREMGKAVARSENHNVTETYDQALKRIAIAESAKTKAAARSAPIDAEVVDDKRDEEPWTHL
jgi:hypothetical protein